MNILGIGGLLHDPSAALLKQGALVAAVESEKVTRHHGELSVFPREAIDAVLAAGGISWDQIDLIATNWDARLRSHLGYVPFALQCLSHGIDPRPHLMVLGSIAASHFRTAIHLQVRARTVPQLRPVRHHLAHVGISYTLSPHDEAAVAIIDGAAETDATSLYYARGRDLRLLRRWSLLDGSLGNLFAMGTQHLGFRMLGDEYKVMALAALGRPNRPLERFFEQAVPVVHGRYRVNRQVVGAYVKNGYHFPDWVGREVLAPRPEGAPLEQEHFDFARAMQDRISTVLVDLMRDLRQQTGCRVLCLGGGVAMNSVINGRIAAEAGYDQVHIPPVAHDGGTAAGAAAWLAFHELGDMRPAPLISPHIASDETEAAVTLAVQRCGLPAYQTENAPAEAARLIASGKIVAWFQGQAEFGPRALGNRSLLGDPRNPAMRDMLSIATKGREPFRPLAVSVLAEHFAGYFSEVHRNPYMTMVAPASPRAVREIPAGVHSDGTSRPQAVDSATFPRFHALIAAFEELTAVPAVLNTSFNFNREPMVRTARDAIASFANMAIDHLFIDGWLIDKGGKRK